MSYNKKVDKYTNIKELLQEVFFNDNVRFNKILNAISSDFSDHDLLRYARNLGARKVILELIRIHNVDLSIKVPRATRSKVGVKEVPRAKKVLRVKEVKEIKEKLNIITDDTFNSFIEKECPLFWDEKKKRNCRQSRPILNHSKDLVTRNLLIALPDDKVLQDIQLTIAKDYKIPDIYSTLEFDANFRLNVITDFTKIQRTQIRKIILKLLHNNTCYTVSRYFGLYDGNVYDMFYSTASEENRNLSKDLDWQYMRLMNEKYVDKSKCPRTPNKHEREPDPKDYIYKNRFFNHMVLDDNDDIIYSDELGIKLKISKETI